jgi:hypothetical protein
MAARLQSGNPPKFIGLPRPDTFHQQLGKVSTPSIWRRAFSSDSRHGSRNLAGSLVQQQWGGNIAASRWWGQWGSPPLATGDEKPCHPVLQGMINGLNL